MKEIIALIVLLSFAIPTFYLATAKRISYALAALFLLFSLVVGVLIANYDLITKFKGAGVEIETIDRREIVYKELHTPGAWQTAEKTPVIGKTFQNQDIALDGHSYKNCTFDNVAFVFKGEAPFDLMNNTIKGSILIKTPTPQLYALVTLQRELGFFRPEITIAD